ncbi:MAG: glycosyltransferase family 2 protein [Candidatus Kerfeldbacteria bacterium]|nr:glycosyltransferase family 2 protein [Candidatus Kerfeldbacteria bacterium]
MNQVLISIIIPCYQAADTIEKTLDSIFKQTYPFLEVIAVDDGSTDQTLLVLKKYQNKITIIYQKNLGASAARNAGFKVSKGEYVLFCDADVVLTNTMISDMLSELSRNPRSAYCYSNFKFGFHTFDLFPFDANRLKKENYISTMSLIRRERFIGFDESLYKFQDWDLWKRMLERGDTGCWVNKRLFYAPMRAGGISSYSLTNIIKLIFRKITQFFS